MNWGYSKKKEQAYKKTPKKHRYVNITASTKPTGKKLLSVKQNDRLTVEKLGLTKKELSYGWDNGSKGTQKERDIGNNLILQMTKMEMDDNPELMDYKLHNAHVLNEYTTAQNILAKSEYNINKLIRWRKDRNPKHWKWESPFPLESGSIYRDGTVKVFDNQNHSFVGDAYKGKVAITIMSPREYLLKVSPRTIKEGKRNDIIRGEEHTKKTIDFLTRLMRSGKPVDTPYMIVDKNGKVFSHEGQHRALSAIRAGIYEMPVYVYAHHEFSDDELEKIADVPTFAIKADTSYYDWLAKQKNSS